MRRAAHTYVAVGMIGLALALTGCSGQTSQAVGATTPAAPTATLAPTQTPTPAGVWATLSGCGANVPASVRVQYQASMGNTLQRSDYCGTTWTSLILPQIPGLANAASATFMSDFTDPANPRTVFLTLQVKGDARLCSAQVCQPQYVSMDSGATWGALTLPAPGVLGEITNSQSVVYGEKGKVQAQGTRLYGIVTDAIIASGGGGANVTPPGRLVVSADGGAHWTLCDAALAAQGMRVWDFTVTPTGTDIYAIAEPLHDPSTDPANNPTLSVWASHDGGQTWAEGGPTPGTGAGSNGGFVTAALASVDPVSGHSILYVMTIQSGKYAALASQDGGKTWQGDSHLTYSFGAGFPTQLLATLPDGSILLTLTAGGGPALAWKPGAVPRAVAQNPNFTAFHSPCLNAIGSSAMLWLSGVTGTADGTSVEYARLQL